MCLASAAQVDETCSKGNKGTAGLCWWGRGAAQSGFVFQRGGGRGAPVAAAKSFLLRRGHRRTLHRSGENTPRALTGRRQPCSLPWRKGIAP
ncbi:hypothetical protein NDU88_002736 [Pleurodeles waltl]|uniref:Uncharacterized protein n=1 Tax=Pleurodeles waltl TaxID=8319 RepID=A0AAV7M3B8_PLEWA|nr:hypothetical protein NDU88_002736 [Pleurodeles waltl]